MWLPLKERELGAASRSWHRTPDQPWGGLCWDRFFFLALLGEPQRQKAAGIPYSPGTWDRDQPLLGLFPHPENGVNKNTDTPPPPRGCGKDENRGDTDSSEHRPGT